ncbi:hypothetical protein Dimus_012140 [Dionaea muscipula]
MLGSTLTTVTGFATGLTAGDTITGFVFRIPANNIEADLTGLNITIPANGTYVHALNITASECSFSFGSRKEN